MRLSDVTLTGGRALGTTFPASHGGAMRIDFFTDVAISRVHFLDNRAPATGTPNLVFGLGGAIAASGVLSIEDSRFEGNQASNSGGALYLSGNFGTDPANRDLIRASIRNTTFVGNVSNGGGAITSHIPLTVTASTLAGNVAPGQGGAIEVQGSIFSSLTLVNSTLSDNRGGTGGAIVHFRPVSIQSSTIAGNQANFRGGGISAPLPDRQATIENTIIAGNTGGTGNPNVQGTVVSLGHNLIGDPTGSSGYVATDLVNSNPLLGPLADNGGPTLTRALLAGSPAIDAAATATAPATDQRGVARPQGAAADIGAFEVGVNHPPRTLADSYSTAEDTPLSVAAPGVLGNDVDLDNDPLTAILVSGPTHGTLDLAADGSFVYTPDANYHGPDSFVYQASDGEALSLATSTVSIDVTPVNDPPVLEDAAFSIPENSPAGTPVGSVAASDADGDAIQYAIVGGNAGGAFAIDPDSGAIRVADSSLLDFETTPAYHLTVEALDAQGDSDTAQVAISLSDVAETASLSIDIRPGDSSNQINIKSHGKLDVAILSTAAFDVFDVDVGSLTFGRTGDEDSLSRNPHGPRYRYADVNGDGRLDLVATFEIELTGFEVGDTLGILKGRTLGGLSLEGSDEVTIRRPGK